MNTGEYCKVFLDFSAGSAYEYQRDPKIPTIIKYKRKWSGKIQRGVITENLLIETMHNVVFMIKRGYNILEIKAFIKNGGFIDE